MFHSCCICVRHGVHWNRIPLPYCRVFALPWCSSYGLKSNHDRLPPVKPALSSVGPEDQIRLFASGNLPACPGIRAAALYQHLELSSLSAGRRSRQPARREKGKCGQLRTVPLSLPQARSWFLPEKMRSRLVMILWVKISLPGPCWKNEARKAFISSCN